ncbi:hypothetical protein [Nonomuraea sp. B1E8]
MSRLPRVLLNSHVKVTAPAVTPAVNHANTTSMPGRSVGLPL